MNNIFRITKFHFSTHLQFKFEKIKKKSTKRNKLGKYIKKVKIGPNFKIEF